MTELPTNNVLVQPMICQHMSVGKSGSWCSAGFNENVKDAIVSSFPYLVIMMNNIAD